MRVDGIYWAEGVNALQANGHVRCTVHTGCAHVAFASVCLSTQRSHNYCFSEPWCPAEAQGTQDTRRLNRGATGWILGQTPEDAKCRGDSGVSLIAPVKDGSTQLESN